MGFLVGWVEEIVGWWGFVEEGERMEVVGLCSMGWLDLCGIRCCWWCLIWFFVGCGVGVCGCW